MLSIFEGADETLCLKVIARRLLERGVRLTGTDAWSWDAPFAYTAKKVAETGNTALIWEGHKAGRDIGFERALIDWTRHHRARWRQLRRTGKAA